MELKGATDALTHARVLIHSSYAAEVEKVVAPGMDVADKGYQAGVGALGGIGDSGEKAWLSRSFLFCSWQWWFILRSDQIEGRQQRKLLIKLSRCGRVCVLKQLDEKSALLPHRPLSELVLILGFQFSRPATC